MKKLKALILTLAILSATFFNQGSTFAANTEVPFDLTPLPINTNLGKYSGAITDDPPSGDFTSTATFGSNGPVYKGFGYKFKIPSSVSLCEGGAKPYIVGYKYVLETKAASPNVQNPNNTGANMGMISGTPNLGDINSTFDYSDTAPQGTLVGVKSLANYYKAAIPMDTFNNSTNVFAGWVTHMTQEGTFTATTAPPVFSAILSCTNSAGTGGQSGVSGGSTESIDDAKEKANTPDTGAVEVIAFVTGAALVFVLYEATRMYKKKSASKMSAK